MFIKCLMTISQLKYMKPIGYMKESQKLTNLHHIHKGQNKQ